MSCGHGESLLLPKTEKFSTCYLPYLNSILNLFFQVALAETAAGRKLWKHFTVLPKFCGKCFVMLSIFNVEMFCKFGLNLLWKMFCIFKEKYFANLCIILWKHCCLFVQKKSYEKCFACVKLCIFAVSLKYSFESL